MQKLKLKADNRDLKQKTTVLREQGQVPGIIYGPDSDPQPIQVEVRRFKKTFVQAGTSQLVQLTVGDDKTKNVLIHEVQEHPVSGEPLHADFYALRMDEKINADIPLRYIGEAPAVYKEEGTLVRNLETVEIEALPLDLPESIEVDISVLDDFDKTIHVSDLDIPDNVELVSDPESLVAKVDPPRSEEELAELEEAVVEELPEGVEEEPEAGEAAEAGEGEAEKEEQEEE